MTSLGIKLAHKNKKSKGKKAKERKEIRRIVSYLEAKPNSHHASY